MSKRTPLSLHVVVTPMPEGWSPDSPIQATLQLGRDQYVEGELGHDAVAFQIEVEAQHGAEDPDFFGKLVHGKRGERFLYVSWAAHPEDGGTPHRFRRLKLYLSPVVRKGWSSDGISWTQVREGRASVAVSGRDAEGGPACGTAATTWE